MTDAAVLPDQPGYLGAGETADLDQVVADQTLLHLAQSQVAKLTKRCLNSVVGRPPHVRGPLSLARWSRLGTPGSLPDWESLGVQFHDYPPMILKLTHSRSPADGMPLPIRAHVPLGKAWALRTQHILL